MTAIELLCKSMPAQDKKIIAAGKKLAKAMDAQNDAASELAKLLGEDYTE